MYPVGCCRRVAVPGDGRFLRGRRRPLVEAGPARGAGAAAGPKDLPRRRRTRTLCELTDLRLANNGSMANGCHATFSLSFPVFQLYNYNINRRVGGDLT